MQKKVISLAGNPNVGKSTVFNSLTKLKQHTGNWAGKTVSSAKGSFILGDCNYTLIDVPGTYSLVTNSKDEEVARDFICFNDSDKIIVVCDATNLRRNFLLLLQIIELREDVILCINMKDEARSNKIDVNIDKLKKILDIDIVYISAKTGLGISDLLDVIGIKNSKSTYKLKYNNHIEKAIKIVYSFLENFEIKKSSKICNRWIAIKLLENDKNILNEIVKYFDLENHVEFLGELEKRVAEANKYLLKNNIDKQEFALIITKTMYKEIDEILEECVRYRNVNYYKKDARLDKLLTSKTTGIPIMLFLLLIIFWITIAGANVPSNILAELFSIVGDEIRLNFHELGVNNTLISLMMDGVYSVVGFVVSVMLPPMAIFFPLFAIMEDFGYLPRVAFNTDKFFKNCGACGKQCLTMAMGFGCNACGIMGCRIIDSKRERLIAIVTNNFVPCNGRFPMIIAVITMFFLGNSDGFQKSFYASIFLTFVVLIGILATFIVSKILSKTLLKGEISSYTLELPPYRKPNIKRSILRSFLDKTLAILGRAVAVSVPAGVIVWAMGNLFIADKSLLFYIVNFLEPFGKFIGLDGVILMGFIIGIPANEIVLPLIIMGYLGVNTINEFDNLLFVKDLLVVNDWTIKTAICMIMFSLFHWPCSTALITVQKETASIKWSFLAFIIPTIIGIIVCGIINLIL